MKEKEARFQEWVVVIAVSLFIVSVVIVKEVKKSYASSRVKRVEKSLIRT